MAFILFTKHIQTGTGPAPSQYAKPGYQDREFTDAYVYEFGSDGTLIVKSPAGGVGWYFAASNWEMIYLRNDHQPGKNGKPHSPPIGNIIKEKQPPHM